ncbi:MAG TPA: T9SS type A sorting domain-containing protein [candidate division WOR-3 bacterium]|uniref:T9SS type A sorting domain-containing protein n=1 Tax=candidate division WOR-3 bacterium TaxID=2052148 RepID=A0A7V5HM35_UNCW3|nr:T9SS type A sorting domain-containing protein [candidate division WOR-3 bacterium]
MPLSLYDVAGRKVISATITPFSPHLDVSQLRSGIYFVVFKERGDTQVKERIIKF